MKYDPRTDQSNDLISASTLAITTEINRIDPYVYFGGPIFFNDGDPWVFRIKDGKKEDLANAPASSQNSLHIANTVAPHKKSDTSTLKAYVSDTLWGKIFLYIDTNADGYFDDFDNDGNLEKLFKDCTTLNDVIFGFAVLHDGSLCVIYDPCEGGISGTHKITDLNSDHDAEDVDEFTRITDWYSHEGLYLNNIACH
jgi:hypothetical protein